jgi:hypothetical protein
MIEINQELNRRYNNRRISFGRRGEADDNAASSMIDYDDDEATSEQRENIFDLIYKIRGEIKQADISGDEVQRLSGLKASLRPYQIDAVKWMMHKEAIGLDAQLHSHPHYIAVRNSFGQCIYLHTFFAVYSTRMPMKLSSIPGGILADEMGLGKTLEILALIGINRRNREQSTTFELADDTNYSSFTPRMQSQVSEVAVSQPEKTTKSGSEKASFSCLCGKTPNQFLAGYTKKEDFDDDEEFNYEDKDDGEVNFDDDDDDEYESDDDEAGNRKRQKRRKKNSQKSRKRQRNRAERQTSSSSLFLSSERNSNRFGERSKQNDQEKVS